MAHNVFISHSAKDKPTADAVCAVLESKGFRCWVAPRDIIPGKDWGESIVDAIKGARVMVLIFSGHANDSPQIKREVERAVNKGIPIIPFRIEDVEPKASLEYFLSTPHWLDAFTPPLEEHLRYLAQIIGPILDTPTKEGLQEPAPKPEPSKETEKKTNALREDAARAKPAAPPAAGKLKLSLSTDTSIVPILDSTEKSRKFKQTPEGWMPDEPLVQKNPIWSNKVLIFAVAAVLMLTVLVVSRVLFRPAVQPVSRTTAPPVSEPTLPPAKALPATVLALPAAGVLGLIYSDAPPSPSTEFVKPQLQFEIKARRKGETDFSPLKDGDALTSDVDEYSIRRTRSRLVTFTFSRWTPPAKRSGYFRRTTHSHSLPARTRSKPGKSSRHRLPKQRRFTLIKLPGSNTSTSSSPPPAGLNWKTTLLQKPESLPSAGPGQATVQQPNNLQTRGIEGERPSELPASNEPLAATGPFLVIERWFKHVNPN